MALPSYFIFLLIPLIFIGITLYITRGQMQNTQSRVRLQLLVCFNAFFFFFTISAVIENLLDRSTGHIEVFSDSPFYFMTRLYSANAFYFLYLANHTFLRKPPPKRTIALARILIGNGILVVLGGLTHSLLPVAALPPIGIIMLNVYRETSFLSIFAFEFVLLALNFAVLQKMQAADGALPGRLRLTLGLAALLVGMYLNYLTNLNYWMMRVTSAQTFSLDFISYVRLLGASLVVLTFAPRPVLQRLARFYLWLSSLASLIQLAFLLRQYWRFIPPLPWGLPPWSQWILHPEFACRWYVVDILDRQNLITLKKIKPSTLFERALFSAPSLDSLEREEDVLLHKARQIAWLRLVSYLKPAQT